MYIRNYISLLLLITYSLLTQGQILSNDTSLDQLKTYYVWATPGLKLRETPAMDGKVVDILPYGTPVTLVTTTEKPIRYKLVYRETSENDAPIILQGHWRKVSTSNT